MHRIISYLTQANETKPPQQQMRATSATNTNNTFHTTKVDGMDTPYPPTAPAYCTRRSVKEMEEKSKELTQLELQKLTTTGTNTSKKSHSAITCVPAVELNPDMHRIMCKYADKQQQLCSQICDLNQRLQAKHDEVIQLKGNYEKKLQSVEDELCHITEVNDGNEDEVTELVEKNSVLQAEMVVLQRKNRSMKYWHPVCTLFWMLLYTLMLLHANHTMDLQMTDRYAVLHGAALRFANRF